ncbi:conserved hypothetical protein [Desulfamplus magnetovallimortis]|uniref:Putative heavy-metal chelation domain-containing protein n=1 Tax=Desulfamplus magnetovallimortis TaxID=1246637 RepID=A0A1W1HJ11_9BACT|nr:DUF364 domain-containing protein [Desulfamplus magnetovallimortis]SLM32450.1 conserved hypothetical protein [Desulfamplus magnetovallimortis]
MYEKLKKAFIELSEEAGILDSEINITARRLTPKEAIGETERQDFPLLHGKESLIQADFRGALGQAFTDMPRDFNGKIREILDFNFDNNGERALFIATLNAVMRFLGKTERTIHCKNESPELCSQEIVKNIIEKHGEKICVGIVGFQPAIIDHFSKTISPENIRITDLDKENIGKEKYGVVVWDGHTMAEEIFKVCDVILATGSTIANNSLGELTDLSEKYGKPIYFYGTTVAGPASILNLNRLCFKAS